MALNEQNTQKTIEDVKKTLTAIEKFNEEQRVIARMNAPLLKQCQEWLDKKKNQSDLPEEVKNIVTALNTFLTKNTGLDEVKSQVELYLIRMTKAKMEELDAYKH